MTVTDVHTTRADTPIEGSTRPPADAPTGPPTGPPPLPPGTRVDVRTRFDQRWTSGFEVLAREEGGYRLRRLSDGSELPTLFARDDLRRERRRQAQWWY